MCCFLMVVGGSGTREVASRLKPGQWLMGLEVEPDHTEATSVAGAWWRRGERPAPGLTS